MDKLDNMSVDQICQFLDGTQTTLVYICDRFLDHSHAQYACAVIQAIAYNIKEKEANKK